MLAPIRSHIRPACLLALLCLLAAALAGFGGAPQPQPEPQTVGPVTGLAASSEAQPAGAVRLSWNPADHAQTHFVIYLKSADAAADNYAGAQMAAFRAPNGIISGLEPGTAYNFTAIGMRWNWNNYGVIWGQWSAWATATPSGTPGSPTAATPTSEPQAVGPVTDLAASSEAQPAGAVRLSWHPADHAQTHFVIYLKSADAAAGSYANAQMAAFRAPNGTISGLEPGAAYNFIAIGMRWNWNNYGVIWGQWSAWATATPSESPGSAAGDRAALIALYHATDGPNWIDSDNWLSDAPLGEWHGVTTNSNGRVIRLFLRRNQLTGEIPPELGNLASLEWLHLYNNRLTGAIPAELGNLANLQQLYLHDNQLTGAIPAELGNLANLQQLSLSGNQLTGCIPAALRNIPSNDFTLMVVPYCDRVAVTLAAADRAILTALYNSADGAHWLHNGNWLSDAPKWYGVDIDNNGHVIRLSLHNNQLTGAIPAELGGLANLRSLSLSGNGLMGALPPELGNLANLQRLDLWGNQLTGAIPPELGNLANLQRLYLLYNRLTGAIPPELGNLANLEDLYLSNNQLTGAIPAELGNLANLEDLYLGDNQLTGAIPAELGNLANLQQLDLGDNQLTGAIPPELGNLANLEDLYLSNNQLTGAIPAELGNLANLQHLNLSRNQLTGVIPTQLGSLANLERLYLSRNQLTGAIPAELGNLANLRWLSLSGNLLTGCIPAALRNVPFNDLASLSLPYCDE